MDSKKKKKKKPAQSKWFSVMHAAALSNGVALFNILV